MIQDVASASTAFLLLLAFWFLPVLLFALDNRERGLGKLNWVLALGVLTWPAYAVFLLKEGIRKH